MKNGVKVSTLSFVFCGLVSACAPIGTSSDRALVAEGRQEGIIARTCGGSADAACAALCSDGGVDGGVACQAPRCGDGHQDPGESCDEGSAHNRDDVPDACRVHCTLPYCGDGVVDPRHREQCDDALATIYAPDGCRFDCTTAHCGDQIRDSDEACDDGDLESGDGCHADCTLEPGAVCHLIGDGKPDHCIFLEAAEGADAGSEAGSDANVDGAGAPHTDANGTSHDPDAGAQSDPPKPGACSAGRSHASLSWLAALALLLSLRVARRRVA